MKKCIRCGTEYADSFKFCSVCGSQLTPAPAPQHQSHTQAQRQAWLPVKQPRPELGLLQFCYWIILLILSLSSMVSIVGPPREYGNHGYGLVEQIWSFSDLMNNFEGSGGQLAVAFGVILLITAALIAASFSIVGIVITAKSYRTPKINLKLMVIVNALILGSFTLIFLLTIAYLTFSFICMVLLSAIAFLLVMHPQFAHDLFRRKENPGVRNTALLTVFSVIIIAFMFMPICAVPNNYPSADHPRVAFNFYGLVINAPQLNSDMEAFDIVMLYVLPFVGLLTAIGLFVYLIYLNFTGKLPKYILINVLLSVIFLTSVLLGATNLTKILKSQDVVNYPSYYIMLALNITMFILRPIFSATDAKHIKRKEEESAIAEAEAE